MAINSSDKSPFEICDSTGKEFREIYDNKGRLLFKNWNEIQGSLPLNFTSRGGHLLDYRIYGNTVQDGTPTPENPVEVVGCGVRTENLCSNVVYKSNYYINEQGVEIKNDRFNIYSVFCNSDTTYTISLKSILSGTTLRIHAYNNGVWIRQTATVPIQDMPLTFTTPTNADEIRVSIVNVDNGNIMLNAGSTALPYEPYGYKIPVTVSDGTNTVTTPVYIGSEPLHKIGDYADYVDFKRGVVVRRIKKLVLTGTENIVYQPEYSRFFFIVSDAYYTGTVRTTQCICNHYLSIYDGRAIEDIPNESIYVATANSVTAFNIKTTDFTDVAGFKSYLAAQYANGTPVTVWYVLAKPEEEPLENLLPIQTIKGTNILTADTTVQPSEMYIKGKIKPIGGNQNG